MRHTILLLLIGLNSYGQQPTGRNNFIEAKILYDSASSVISQFQDNKRAIELLEEATRIDSNYFKAFARKLDLQIQLKQFDRAIVTGEKIIRLKPEMPLFQVLIGALYEKKLDSTIARKYYEGAAICFDKLLDTMNTSNRDYQMLVNMKALNLVFVGQREKAIGFIKEICKEQKDEYCQILLTSFETKSRKEMIDEIFDAY